jgi:P27 family predicted phage terminase small subunit
MLKDRTAVDLACPSHLPEAARPVWDATIAAMVDAGTLAAESLVAIERYCLFYDRWREAEAMMAADGVVVRAKRTGVPAVSIWFSISRVAAVQMGKLEAELGLVPARRGRVTRAMRALQADGTPGPRTAWEELIDRFEIENE